MHSAGRQAAYPLHVRQPQCYQCAPLSGRTGSPGAAAQRGAGPHQRRPQGPIRGKWMQQRNRQVSSRTTQDALPPGAHARPCAPPLYRPPSTQQARRAGQGGTAPWLTRPAASAAAPAAALRGVGGLVQRWHGLPVAVAERIVQHARHGVRVCALRAPPSGAGLFGRCQVSRTLHGAQLEARPAAVTSVACCQTMKGNPCGCSCK